MSDKKLTKWEAGNVVVRANDMICDCKSELDDYPKLYEALEQARLIIQKAFVENDLEEEMGFGI